MEGRGQRRIEQVTALLCRRKSKGGEDSSLTAPPAAGATKLQQSHEREGESMTLTLTDHCSMTVQPFHKGSKDDKDNLKISFFFCFFLNVWLCHVLIQTRTHFCLLCKSIQRGSFHMNGFARVDGESATHPERSSNVFFFFLCSFF